MRRLAIDVQPGEYAVARLAAEAPTPVNLLDPGEPVLVSVTRTPTELSIICPAGFAPESANVEAGWRLLTVRGPLAFTLTGIIAALSSELAAAGIDLGGEAAIFQGDAAVAPPAGRPELDVMRRGLAGEHR